MTYILVIMYTAYSSGGYAVTIPGFKSLKECEQQAEKVRGKGGFSPREAVCLERNK